MNGNVVLFATEMVSIQKTVSDLHWKNIARTKHKCPLGLRFLRAFKFLGGKVLLSRGVKLYKDGCHFE